MVSKVFEKKSGVRIIATETTLDWLFKQKLSLGNYLDLSAKREKHNPKSFESLKLFASNIIASRLELMINFGLCF